VCAFIHGPAYGVDEHDGPVFEEDQPGGQSKLLVAALVVPRIPFTDRQRFPTVTATFAPLPSFVPPRVFCDTT
jgi:hypothetical protein